MSCGLSRQANVAIREVTIPVAPRLRKISFNSMVEMLSPLAEEMESPVRKARLAWNNDQSRSAAVSTDVHDFFLMPVVPRSALGASALAGAGRDVAVSTSEKQRAAAPDGKTDAVRDSCDVPDPSAQCDAAKCCGDGRRVAASRTDSECPRRQRIHDDNATPPDTSCHSSSARNVDAEAVASAGSVTQVDVKVCEAVSRPTTVAVTAPAESIMSIGAGSRGVECGGRCDDGAGDEDDGHGIDRLLDFANESERRKSRKSVTCNFGRLSSGSPFALPGVGQSKLIGRRRAAQMPVVVEAVP
eukprot:TRINITY_DN19130_c0_g1_i2.p1 TRINITY_DN19130_c0_g1~~TRINITY_DN19130_c0_g1_i2.p1  ORF type:complete len:300 (+),score=51.88 TRINITY_DN19130_c0_g1_i2:84-983(+)